LEIVAAAKRNLSKLPFLLALKCIDALLGLNGEPRMSSDKLLIDLFGLTISADGTYAIIAAVIIIVLAVARPR
jgi:hypothetical protein